MKSSVWVGFCSLGLAISNLACGEVSDDGDPLADAGTVADADPDDRVAPGIVSITPADGAAGVTADTPVVVTFSEAMDPESTVAALTITGSLSGTPETSWTQDGTVLTISAGFQEATGPDPGMVEALAYQVEIGAAATDLAGNQLDDPASVSFTTARRITLSLLSELPGTANDLSGHSQEGGTRYSFLCAGDDDEGDGEERAYVSYDISALPAELLRIEAATFHGDVLIVAGDPSAVFGELLVEHVVFASWGAESWAAEPLRTLPALLAEGAAVAVGDSLSVDVTEAVQEDYQLRSERGDRTQLRFRFAGAPSVDGIENEVCLRQGDTDDPPLAGVQLDVAYLLE